MNTKVLIVDDETRIAGILSRVLSEEGFEVNTASTGEEGIEKSESFRPDIVLMDLNLPGISGIESMCRIHQRHPKCLVLILTAYGTIVSAVEAMQKGAYDYLTKPVDNDELILTLRRVEERLKLEEQIHNLKDQLREKYRFESIIGQSLEIRTVFELMERVASTDATVLVQGESGTGKELIVRAIHHASARKDGPFVAVNCGAIPQNLVESRFFGHEKGAFTDAKERRIGAFEQAHRGTLFLDEVGELGLDDQVKLLRAIEERKITRIGGSEEIPVDMRLIAATNRNLESAVEQKRFRQDLYFRLNVFSLEIPPLRQRKEDIPLLIDHFMDKYRVSIAPEVKTISQAAVGFMQAYAWPGNVRELENAIQSALIVCRKGSILPQHLPMRIQGYPPISEEFKNADMGLEAKILRITEEAERTMILHALKECGSRTRAAEKLQISRKTLFNKMQKLGIQNHDSDSTKSDKPKSHDSC